MNLFFMTHLGPPNLFLWNRITEFLHPEEWQVRCQTAPLL